MILRHAGIVLTSLLLTAACAGIAWTVWKRQTAPPAETGPTSERRLPVEAVEVASGLIRDVRNLSGTLEASSKFIVASKAAGRLAELLVDLGDPVERGQVVATLDDAEYVQAAAQSEAELMVREAARRQAMSALALSQRDYQRAQELQEQGIAPEAHLDEAEAALRSNEAALAVATAQVEQARALLELAKIRLGYTRIEAMWSDPTLAAVVSERHQDAGNTVQAGEPILSVVALDPLTAVVSVTERDYGRLSIGQTATLHTDATPGRTFDATIMRISPIFREASRQARIELRVRNADGVLKPGLFVRARIVLREETAERIVPLDAIVRRNGHDVIYIVNEEGDRVREVPVTIGIVEGDRAQVHGEGITGRVVTLGQQLLRDGSGVSIAEIRRGAAGSSAGSGAGR